MPVVGAVGRFQQETDYGYITTRITAKIRDLVTRTDDGIILECIIKKEFVDAKRTNTHVGRIILNMEQAKQFSQLLLDGIQQIENSQKGYQDYLKEEAATKIAT
jgi:hypothetical protein